MGEELFFEVKIVCPVCGTEFVATKTKSKIRENMPMGYEAYLLPIYPIEDANPLSYEIDICPHCYYTAFNSDFKDKKTNVSRVFSEDIRKILKDTDIDVMYRDYGLARLLYVLAAFMYEKEKQRDYIKLGKCYIRIAWYSKELKESDFYRTALKKSLDIYLSAYNEIDEFPLSAMLLYLICSIFVELGDFESAVPYLNKLNGNPDAKNLPAIKERLEVLTVSIRKRLKEIDDETKNLSEEERKKLKLGRANAVKTKPYQQPFGIELEIPTTKHLEKRVEQKKDELEENFGIKLTGKKKIMIVDDSKVIRNTLKSVLEQDYDVVGMASNGSEGLQMYEIIKPDFVTLDIEMPDMNGIEALKKLKKMDKNAKVIIMTSKSDSKMVVDALKNGAIGYLLKPINRDKIIEIINKNSK